MTSSLQVYIAYPIKSGAWGGGNQFLKNLSNQLRLRGNLATTPKEADVILFNSHQEAREVVSLKEKYPSTKFVHRLDGPMRLYNTMTDERDGVVYYLNFHVADATIFQSKWSQEQNEALGLFPSDKPSTVIYNSVDSSLFNKDYKHSPTEKVKIISTSFSPNIKKGFLVYKFLDQNLDFDKFEYFFCGKSPIAFDNIKCLGILEAHQIAETFRNMDAYITASENDPCSNSLLEAIFSGLSCFALNKGGHPELLQNENYLFDNPNDLLSKLMIFQTLPAPSYPIISNTLEKVASMYTIFMESLFTK